MNDVQQHEGELKLREQIVKNSLAAFDWSALQHHLDDIHLSRDQLRELRGYIRRFSDLICKYPRKDFERQRARFFDQLCAYAEAHLGTEASDEIANETKLIGQIEHGYRSILDVLGKCAISQKSPVVRVSGSISRACHEYQELMHRHNKTLEESKELNLISGLHLQDDAGNIFSPDAVLEGLSESVAMTLIMEAYKNRWFIEDTVVLPELPVVGNEERYQSGSTQALALCWRQWQRVEKRRRFLGGDLLIYSGDQLPPDLPDQITTLITYHPEDEGLSEGEIYDYLGNMRLHDRLIQTFMEMEIESGLLGKGVGIAGGAALPPAEIISLEEAHAGISLSELLGYSIAEDDERPAGLRLIEWVRGYIVLKEIAKARTEDKSATGDIFSILLADTELVSLLQSCGLKDDVATQFISLTCLHRSSRDMFDCPLIRVGPSNYLLFGPAIIDLNIAMAVLSNLSNRGAELGRKGKAFEHSVHEIFRKRGMPVFGFRVRRDGEEYEYDAVVPWDKYLFVFECKNRSLSGNDPTQAYYFDLEVASQAKQVRRLADALAAHPDIIEKEIGIDCADLTIVPCVLHSLPYSRVDELDGAYFTDWSALTRFFDQPYFRIKVPHRIGNVTLLHRTAVRKLWKGDTPTANDFLEQLRSPFQLELSIKHLDVAPVQFAISVSELVVTPDLVRTEMTARSICEVMGVDTDKVLQEIAAVSEKAKAMRSKLEPRVGDRRPQSGPILPNDS